VLTPDSPITGEAVAAAEPAGQFRRDREPFKRDSEQAPAEPTLKPGPAPEAP
jgi:hypothetical protein